MLVNPHAIWAADLFIHKMGWRFPQVDLRPPPHWDSAQTKFVIDQSASAHVDRWPV
jgi:hypothetical protein